MSGALRRGRNLLSLSEIVASTMRPLYGAGGGAETAAGGQAETAAGGQAETAVARDRAEAGAGGGGRRPRVAGARRDCVPGRALSSAGMDVTLIVDGANVMGSRADGWWRDRAGAMARLHGELAALAARGIRGPVPGDPAAAEDADPGGDAAGGPWYPHVYLVVEGRARGMLDLVSPAPAVRVVAARGEGDDEIADLAGRLTGHRIVITADRELRRRCIAAGAAVTGPSWLIRQFAA